MPSRLSTVCVFCGSSPGADPAFAEAARDFGHLLAGRGLGLVYGGGHVGLMGAVADGVIEAGGTARGVITRALEDREIAHTGLAELRVVETMHERKAAMADMADGFVMLPGGVGTWEEFIESVTWTQLGIHAKPCGILNVAGFYDPLVALFDSATEQRFIRTDHRALVLVADDAVALLDAMAAWRPTAVPKWLDRSER